MCQFEGKTWKLGNLPAGHSPIAPQTTQVKYTRVPSSLRVRQVVGERSTVPLTLGSSFTVYAAQGKTLPSVVVDDAGSATRNAGNQSYTAMSRATCLSGVCILNYNPDCKRGFHDPNFHAMNVRIQALQRATFARLGLAERNNPHPPLTAEQFTEHLSEMHNNRLQLLRQAQADRSKGTNVQREQPQQSVSRAPVATPTEVVTENMPLEPEHQSFEEPQDFEWAALDEALADYE